jgi:hypothetical protein
MGAWWTLLRTGSPRFGSSMTMRTALSTMPAMSSADALKPSSTIPIANTEIRINN